MLAWMMIACSTRGSAPTPEPEPPPTVEEARAFAASLPEYMRPMPYTPVPEGLPDLRAETCGSCHQEIYDEWRRSTHAHALDGDPQFMAELHKSSQPESDVGWVCLSCHTPVENQLPRLVARLEGGRLDRPVYVDNPDYDEGLRADAITCATCHVRDGVILGPYGDSVGAPHPVEASGALKGPEVCTQCHQATAHFPDLNLACFFNTGKEWAASPYAADGQTCQSCHMPAVERPIVPWGEPRPTRRHWFGGSLIPKTPDDIEEIKPLQAAYPHGVTVHPLVVPETLVPGQSASILARYENDQAGHYMPSGDPERFLRLELSVSGPGGESIAAITEQIGSVYEWYPEIKLISDNRMAPLEKRQISLDFVVPEQGPVTVALVATKWRLSQENLEYHDLQGKVVPGITFAEERRQIPVQ
jgi:hypothetical protein